MSLDRDSLLSRFGDPSAPRARLRPFVLTGVAGAAAGYVVGRRVASADPPRTPAVAAPGHDPASAMEAATAVEVSRPQPAELDEVVPPAGARA